jgi:hypothetical protein
MSRRARFSAIEIRANAMLALRRFVRTVTPGAGLRLAIEFVLRLGCAPFNDVDELAARVLDFQGEYAKRAQPFHWTFTRRDLHALLDRLDQHGRLAPAA